MQTKKNWSQIYKNHSLLASIITLIITSALFIAVYTDMINFHHDDKHSTFQKKYAVMFSVYKKINGIPVFNTQPYFFNLNGTVYLHTTTRSTQNPIHVTISLDPYGVETSPYARSLQDVMPKTLHYVFPGAIDPNLKNNENSLNQVIIPITQQNSPFGYYGEGTIQYEDPNDYGYYLQEKDKTIRVYDNGTVSAQFSFDFNKIPAQQVRIGEEDSVNQIHIEPYSQTSSIISDKNNWYIALSVVFIGSISTSITLWKRISNKSH